MGGGGAYLVGQVPDRVPILVALDKDWIVFGSLVTVT